MNTNVLKEMNTNEMNTNILKDMNTNVQKEMNTFSGKGKAVLSERIVWLFVFPTEKGLL